jgi:hypothetical protein
MIPTLIVLTAIAAKLAWIIKELRSIKKILRNGVRTFPLPSRIVFLNSEGERVGSVNIQDSGQVLTFAIAGADAAGNPAPLDPASVPVFSLDDTSMGSIAGQVFTPSGKLGTVNIDVSIPAVNAQPALAGSLAVAVVAGAAVVISVSGSVGPVAAPAPAAG